MWELIDALDSLYDYLKAALRRYAIAGQLIVEPPLPPPPPPYVHKGLAMRKRVFREAKCEECGAIAELCSHCNGCFVGDDPHCCVCDVKSEPAPTTSLTPNLIDFLSTRTEYYNHVPLPSQQHYNVTTNALGDSYVVVQEEIYPWNSPTAEVAPPSPNYRRGPAAHLFDEEPF